MLRRNFLMHFFLNHKYSSRTVDSERFRWYSDQGSHTGMPFKLETSLKVRWTLDLLANCLKYTSLIFEIYRYCRCFCYRNRLHMGVTRELRCEARYRSLRIILIFCKNNGNDDIFGYLGIVVFQLPTLRPSFLTDFWDSCNNKCARIVMRCIMTPYSSSNSIADFH